MSVFLVQAHGVVNVVGWGIFLPSGVIVARYFRSYPKQLAWWGAFHVGLQSSGFILGSIGWGIGLWLGQASQHYTFTTHRILAVMIFTFTTIQVIFKNHLIIITLCLYLYLIIN